MFDIKVLFPGFSGRIEDFALGLGTWSLLVSENDNILVDTGGYGLRGSFNKKLNEFGLKASDIDKVLLTHLHFDHAGNVDLLKNAVFYLHEKEWEYANNFHDDDLYIDKNAISILKKSKKILLSGEEGEILDGLDYIHTPGHTPGSTSYIINKKDGNKWYITGDAIKNRGELISGEVQITRDYELSKLSIEKIKDRANKILPGHDGLIKINKDSIIPEGGNDKKILFEEGVTINNGKKEIILSMD